jgi:hypothetical protein
MTHRAEKPNKECPFVDLSFDAAALDLDGVITQTASLHAAAWKQLFDSFLERRAARTGQAPAGGQPGRAYEFLFVWSPLKMKGGTGSPGNPVALY